MPNLPKTAAVVVIGGGAVGTSAAFHLAEAGVDVVLVERAELGSGSTVHSAGGFRAQFSDELNIEISLRSIDALSRFGERPGGEIDFHQVGYLFLLDRPHDVEVFERSVALQNRCGVPSRLIDAAEARALSPLLDTTGVLAATTCPIDGHATPEAVVQGYAAGARRHGAHLETGCLVTAIELDGEAIRRVVTAHGTIETDTVICAAGPWSADVAQLVGADLPVKPWRREVRVTEPWPAMPRPLPLTIDFSTGFYFHAEGPGLLFGMGDPEQPYGFDVETREEWLESVLAVAERRAPSLLDQGIASGWHGFYEMSPDHSALVGELSGVSRFLYATGFSGHGFQQAPAVGEVLRDLVRGVPPVVDVSGFSVERFANAEARPEHNIV